MVKKKNHQINEDLSKSSSNVSNVKNKSFYYTRHIRELLLVLFFISIIFTIYSNVIDSFFLFDDKRHISNNLHIRLTELSWEGIKEAAFESPAKRRPVVNITFALNYYIHGYDRAGYHVFNILIHIITGIFLFFFIKKTVELSLNVNRKADIRYRKEQAETQNLSSAIPNSVFGIPFTNLVAFSATLIWLVHPLHTQSVTYIVQRMNSMAAMFYILSFLFYVKGRLSENKKSGWLFFLGCALSGILALGSKEIAVTLPIFIILYEWYFFQNLSIKWVKRRILPLSGIIVFLIIIAFLYLGVNPLDKVLSGYNGRDFTLLERVITEFRVVILYITLLFFPHPTRLNLDYDFQLSQSLIEPATTLLSLASIVILIVLAVYLARRERLISFCILWFFGNLVLESSVIGLELVYEHRTYLPSMMASLLIVIVVHRYLKLKVAKVALFCAVVIVFSLWTYERNNVWNDELTFWRDVVKKSPGKARPHNNLGNVLSRLNMSDEAIYHYFEALRLNPSSLRVHNNIGNTFLMTGKIKEAIGQFYEELKINPEYAEAHNNLGYALAMQGNYQEAGIHYRRALRIDPNNSKAHNNLGDVLLRIGKLDDAISHFQEALRIDHDYEEAQRNLTYSLKRKTSFEKAITKLEKEIKVNPESFILYNEIGKVYQRGGFLDKAIKSYRSALLIRPDYLPALKSLAIAYASKEEYQKALYLIEKLVKLDPDCAAPYYYNMACLYAKQNKNDECIDWLKQAIERGFDDWELIKTDNDLNSIRNLPRYKGLIKGH